MKLIFSYKVISKMVVLYNYFQFIFVRQEKMTLLQFSTIFNWVC